MRHTLFAGKPTEKSLVILSFEPQDVWIGVYWKKILTDTIGECWNYWKIYVCVVPMFPVFVTWARMAEWGYTFSGSVIGPNGMDFASPIIILSL